MLIQRLIPIEEMLGVGVDVDFVGLAGGGFNLLASTRLNVSTAESYIPAADLSAGLLLLRMNSAWSLRSLIRRWMSSATLSPGRWLPSRQPSACHTWYGMSASVSHLSGLPSHSHGPARDRDCL